MATSTAQPSEKSGTPRNERARARRAPAEQRRESPIFSHHPLEVDSPTIAVLAPNEHLGDRLRSVLEAARFRVLVIERTVPGLIRNGAHSIVVFASARSISERRTILLSLRRRLPETRVVVVGPRDSRAAVRATIEAGAAGVLYDTDIERSLIPTVEAVLAGQVVVPADGRREIDPPTLSGREKQALGLVVMGLSNREIASQLYLAESTVKCHLSSAFAKLGVRSRHEAVSEILRSDNGIGVVEMSTLDRPKIEATS